MKSIGKRGLGAIAAVSVLALMALPGLATAHGGGAQEGTALEPCPMATGSQSMMGPGMGQGMMGHGSGQGMMGPGMGQGMMGPDTMGPGHGMRVVSKADISTDDVRHFLEDHLAMHGNERLKVGEVTEADDDSIVADIVTLEDSLVQRFKVDRHSGRMQRTE